MTTCPARAKIDLVVHELAPYRVHLIRRLAVEIPEVEFRVLLTTELGGFRWDARLPRSIECVVVGRGQTIAHAGKLRSWPREWVKGGRLIGLLESRAPDAVVLFGYGDFAHLRALHFCRERQISALLSADSNVRADRPLGFNALVKGRLLRWVVDSCAALLPWGSLGVDYFRRYGAPPERIFRVPHEPDYDLIQRMPHDAARGACMQFSLDDRRHRLIFSGRLAPEKRVDLLLRAFADVAARRPDWDLLIMGGGPLEAELRAQVSPELAKRVIWTGPITDARTLAALYRCGDVLVLPSEFDPWGIVVNEALAAGMIVVCSDAVGAGADLVRDGVNGRVFAAGDLAGLVDCVLDVTRADLMPARQAAGEDILRTWRRDHDPVEGLRRALRAVGVLPMHTVSNREG